MASRPSLNDYFKTIVDNVYYQPPVNIHMKYPAIRYSRNDIDNTFANDNVYLQNRSYEVTVIDYDPDSPIVDAVSKMPTARFNRHYTTDGLNHDVFIIYW